MAGGLNVLAITITNIEYQHYPRQNGNEYLYALFYPVYVELTFDQNVTCNSGGFHLVDGEGKSFEMTYVSPQPASNKAVFRNSMHIYELDKNPNGYVLWHNAGDLQLPCTTAGGEPVTFTEEELRNNTSLNSKKLLIETRLPIPNKMKTESRNYGIGSQVVFTFEITIPKNYYFEPGSSITLNNGAVVQMSSQNRFVYTVQEGDVQNDLEVVSFNGIIYDDYANFWPTIRHEHTYSINQHGLIANGIYAAIDGVRPTVDVECGLCNQTVAQNQLEEVIMASDVGTGIKEIRYAWSNTSTSPNNNSYSVLEFHEEEDQVVGYVPSPTNSLRSGDVYLHVRVTDHANNSVEQVSGPYILDKDGPSLKVDPASLRTKPGARKISITAQDPSGVKVVRYRWDFGDWIEVDETSFEIDIPVTHGDHRLDVEATDGLGNIKSYYTPYITVDANPPVIHLDYTDAETPKTSHNVTIKVEGDDLSFERVNLYTIWSQSAEKPAEDDSRWVPQFTNQFSPRSATLTSPAGQTGFYYLHLKAMDFVKNTVILTVGEEIEGGVAFAVDNTAPKIEVVYAGNPEVYAPSVTLGVQVTDEISDRDNIEVLYQIVRSGEQASSDSSAWTRLNGDELTISDKSGDYVVYLKATDEAGHVATFISPAYALDHLPPEGSVKVKDDRHHTNQQQVTLELEAEDMTAIEYRYKVADGEWSGWDSYLQNRTAELSFEDAVTEGPFTIYVQFRDEAGNISEHELEMVYDTKPPEIMDVSLTPDTYTNQPVVVEVKYEDDYSPAGIKQETYTANGTYTISVSDLAGNMSSITVTIDNLDYEAPQVTFGTNGDTKKRQRVATTVTAVDNRSEEDQIWLGYAWLQTDHVSAAPEEWEQISSGEEVSKSDGDGQWYLWVKAVDQAGNPDTSVSQAFWLDNTPPTVTEVVYSTENRTAMPVDVWITFSEPVYLTAPYTTSEPVTVVHRTFEDNGSVSYIFQDEAGNQGTYVAAVDWIDSSLPNATVKRSTDAWTKESVRVTISVEGDPPRALLNIVAPEDAVLVHYLTAEGEYRTGEDLEPEDIIVEAVFDMHSNGTITFQIEDLDTKLTNDGQAVVTNIDKQKPTGEIQYSTKNWTNQDVTVTLHMADNSGEAPVVLSEGGSMVVFTENGTHTFRIRDAAGNEAEFTATVDWIAKSIPEPVITLSTEDWTQEAVVAIITFPGETAPITITNTNNLRTYTFNENGAFTFYYQDAAGNTGNSGEIRVDWIDREAPTATLQYSVRGWTNQDVVVTAVVTDNSGAPITFLNEGGSQHTFTENGSFLFEYEDAAGNRGSIEAIVDRIDKLPLTAEVHYSPSGPTNLPVRATVVPNKSGVKVLNNQGMMFYDFVDNGSFQFIIEDRAGNTATIEAHVSNIKRGTPSVRVVYSTTELTNQPVIARVESTDPDELIYVINNYRRHEYIFTENGSFTFIVQDEAGNRIEVPAQVSNIDKSKANTMIVYSETAPTRNDVTVKIESDRPLTVLSEGHALEMTFTTNGTKWVHARDELGNEYWFELSVRNIDRQAPEVQYLDVGSSIVIPVHVQLNEQDLTADIRIVDGHDGDLTDKVTVRHALTTDVPGLYDVQYEVSDSAGNTLQFVRQVRVVSVDSLAVYMQHEQVGEFQPIVIRGNSINFQVYGHQGKLQVQWMQGLKRKGDFKREASWIATDRTVIPVERSGYYSILVRDQQRNYQLFHVFVYTTR
jgi:hypothetical protein